MKKTVFYLILPIMIVSLQSVVAAQPADTQQPKWYQIEMIVFTHPTETENAVLEDPNALPWKGIPSDSIELNEDPSLLGYQRLSPSAFLLKSEERRLARHQGYQVRLHIAWQQPGLDAKSAKPVHIFGGQAFFADGQPITSIPTETTNMASPDSTEIATKITSDNVLLDKELASQEKTWEIEGTVKIAKDRFFDILTQLRLLQPTEHWSGPYSTLDQLVSDHGSVPPGFTQVVLKQSRRMRSNQLNYLDHPQLGALIKITPIDTPQLSTNHEIDAHDASTAE